jgi:TPR repeat protein
MLYYNGEGVPKDANQAVSWWCKAGEQGLSKAQYNLALIYERGERVPKDTAQAMAWYHKAAEQGDISAQYNLGLMHATGVPKDLIAAYMWWNLAAAQGDEGAKKSRDTAEQQMTPAQIAEAQKLSREWKPKP